MDHTGFATAQVGMYFWVYTAQAPGSSAWVLFQVGPEFHAVPRTKPLWFLGSLSRVTDPDVLYILCLSGLSSSGDQVLGERIVAGGPRVLFTSSVLAA